MIIAIDGPTASGKGTVAAGVAKHYGLKRLDTGSLYRAVGLAVVDAGGVLRASARMDGAEIAGEALAVDKAYTAVAHRTSTAELGASVVVTAVNAAS